jgi:hypothetical protein
MNDHRKMDPDSVSQFQEQFEKAWKKVKTVFDVIAFRKVVYGKEGKLKIDNAVNRAVFDIQMFSLQDIQEDVLTTNAAAIQEAFVQLCLNDSDFADSVSHSTADRKRFYVRLAKWGKKLTELGIAVTYLGKIPQEFL